MKSRAINVRKLPDDVYTALKMRAANRGCSTEAAAREILVSTLKPASRVLLGSELHKIGRYLELTDDECDYIANIRYIDKC